MGAELTGGCYGFATRYNHWPEQLLVGSVAKNESGHIVQAKGLQSVIQLMGEKDLFDYWSDTYKTHTMSWTPSRAGEILAQWQRSFSEEVATLLRERRDIGGRYDVAAFSTSQFDTVLEQFAQFSWVRMAVGFALMISYTAFVLFRWTDVVHSQSGLGIGGVILVAATIAAGLGLCAFLGLGFNAATSPGVPSLGLGPGGDGVLLMVRCAPARLGEARGGH